MFILAYQRLFSFKLGLKISGVHASDDLPSLHHIAFIDKKLRDPASGQNQLLNTLKLYRKQNDQFKVIIRGEADMPYRFLSPVLVACADANVRNVNFNTKKVKEVVEGQ